MNDQLSPHRPTRIRYLVIASATLMSVLLYLDRFCISIAQVYIQQDLGLTNGQIGVMLSAFFLTYALSQVPSGWLTDRFGSRIMLTIYIVSWSLFTGLTGAAGAFGLLLLLRLGFGFAQAGAYPTAASITSKWAPFAARGKVSSLIALGGRIGGFLAMMLTPFVLIWLTPPSTPTLLAPSDLLDGPLLCHELTVEPQPSTPVSRLRRKSFGGFSPSAQAVVRRNALAYSTALKAEQDRLAAAGKKPKNAVVKDLPETPGGELSVVAEELNGIIGRSGFFESQELASVPLEKEAVRLSKKAASERTQHQSQRLNRLVLEGLHRDSLKRIYVAGWRPTMYLFGSLGVVVAALVWWSSRDTPRDHPRCNAAEVALIEAGRPMHATGTGKVGGAPIVPLLCSLSMWLSCVSQWFTNVGWVFLMTLAPRYFMNVHAMSLEGVSWMVAIPPLVGWLGMLSGGVVTDSLVARIGLRWGRALPMSLSRFVAMGAYLACLSSPSPWFAVAMFSIVAFATNLGTAATWAFVQDVGGRHVGSVLGWGNMWGNLGAAVAPALLMSIVGDAERWNLAFLTCALAFLFSGIAAAGINATIPIVSNKVRT